MEEVDFINATEESREHINTWVADKTEGENTALLCLNSILISLIVNSFTRPSKCKEEWCFSLNNCRLLKSASEILSMCLIFSSSSLFSSMSLWCLSLFSTAVPERSTLLPLLLLMLIYSLSFDKYCKEKIQIQFSSCTEYCVLFQDTWLSP